MMIIFELLFSLIIWVIFLYGVLAVIKKIYRKLRGSGKNNARSFDEYPGNEDNYTIYQPRNIASNPYNDNPRRNNQRNKIQDDIYDEYPEDPSEAPAPSRDLQLSDILRGSVDKEKQFQERKIRGSVIVNYLRNKLNGERFYKLDKIPAKKIANARSAMSIPEDDIPLALFDNSIMGNGKMGVVISVDGIYWKNMFEPSNFISWDNIKTIYINNKIKVKMTKLSFGGYGNIDTMSSSYKKDDLISTIKELSHHFSGIHE